MTKVELEERITELESGVREAIEVIESFATESGVVTETSLKLRALLNKIPKEETNER